MTIFYLVRHGQADYSLCDERGYPGFGRDLAPLSKEGVRQAEQTARDPRLKDAQMIVSSPYTRALQTAAIISRVTGVPLAVEMDLHEWLPDLTFRYSTGEESVAQSKAFDANRGKCPDDAHPYESLEQIRARMVRVRDKYASYDKVVLVGHGMALRSIAPAGRIRPAEIVEFTYETGQPVCEYEFV